MLKVPEVVIQLLWKIPFTPRRYLFQLLRPEFNATLNQLRTINLAELQPTQISLQGFDKHRCIFVHIPKCGGISVGRALFGTYYGNHMNALTYQLIFDKSTYDAYFKFTFVRNPWSRLFSAFHFLRNGRTIIQFIVYINCPAISSHSF